MWPYPERSGPPRGLPMSKGLPQPLPHGEGIDGRRYENTGPRPPPHNPPYLHDGSEPEIIYEYRGGHGYPPPHPPPHHLHHHHHRPPQRPLAPPPHHRGPPYALSDASTPLPGSYYEYPPHNGHGRGTPPHPHHGPPPPPPPRHGHYPPARSFYEPNPESRGPVEDTEQPRHGGGCTCKKSQCLKLYCQCFSSSTTCGPKCRCQACHNTTAHGCDIEEARRIILERNPSAFSDKFAGRNRPYWEDPQWGPRPPTIQQPWSYNPPEPEVVPPPALPPPAVPPPVTHKMGCKCRRSFCLKKYCECYTRGAQCGSNCRCSNCRNHPNASVDSPPPNQERTSPILPSLPPMPTTLEAALQLSAEEEEKKDDKMAIMAALAMTELLGTRVDDRKRKVPEEVSTQSQKRRSSPTLDEEILAVVSSSSDSPTVEQSRNPSPVAPARDCHNKNEEREHARTSPRPYEDRNSGLPKSLSFRKICSKCGKTRGEHGELGFGNKCVYQDCGRCGAGVQMHMLANVPMGILCTLSVEDGAIPGAADRYNRKIRDLAVRAEMERGLKAAKQAVNV